MTCYKKKVIIAFAGSGKTYDLIQDAISQPKVNCKRVLIVTYTKANTIDLQNKVNLRLHPNIDVMSWESFLLHHLIKPYHRCLTDLSISSIDYDDHSVNFYKESQIENHFFASKSKGILRGKTAGRFALLCNEVSGDLVFSRLSDIYQAIYVDEVQDISGFDLDILEHLKNANMDFYAVGDPRQCIYFTNSASKNKKYKGANILLKLQEWAKNGSVQLTTKNESRRCCQDICNFAVTLWPNYPQIVHSTLPTNDPHMGHWVVRSKDFGKYCAEFYPTIITFKYNEPLPQTSTPLHRENVGILKGKTLDHVLIVLPKTDLAFLQNSQFAFADETRCKTYVAITRAKYSVAFLYDGITYLPVY